MVSVGVCAIRPARLAHGAEQQLGQSEDAMPRAALAPDRREQLVGRAGAGSHGRRDHLLGGDHSSAGMSHLGLDELAYVLLIPGLHNQTKVMQQ